MFKWGVGEPYKKTYRIIMVILVLVLMYAMLQIFIPTILGKVEAGARFMWSMR